MIRGLSGSLLSAEALAVSPGAATHPDAAIAAARRRLVAWHAGITRDLGPASAARTVLDRVAAPLVAELGFRPVCCGPDGRELQRAVLYAGDAAVAGLVVVAWGREPAAGWRESVRLGIGHGLRWCFCVNGPVVRVIDTRRTYSRRFIEFDLGVTLDDAASFVLFWHLLCAAAFTSATAPALDQAIRASELHRSAVRASLQRGVHDALGRLMAAFAAGPGRRQPAAGAVLDDSLIVIYRVLFLLFAEARGLVPRWHPAYERSYTIEALRDPIERDPHPAGLWESLQAISRLAHQGCRAGSLRVTAFNGRLFSPAHAPLAETAALDDGRVREAMIALTTRSERGARRRISFADLGVEQLGGVYERLLDFDPAWTGGPRASIALVPGDRRRAAGAFYTPRFLTEYLVRRTLAPLVQDLPAERILSIRVLDPSMGSGAFLVASCRYLASAYEAALVRDGSASTSDLGDADRAGFRRLVAQRCLFGVDLNPMAVQLGRLSLWLATLAADRPLTFLDHHLRTGNSLAGATLEDVACHPPGVPRRLASLPLFDDSDAAAALGRAASARLSITMLPGETIDQVREKERLLAGVGGGPLGRWKTAADLWCAGWVGEPWGNRRGGHYGALLDQILDRACVLPAHLSAPLLAAARDAAARDRFFHWTLEFPEVFFDADGRPLENAGFDAVICNPPWEILRGRSGGGSPLQTFVRTSGIYRLRGGGHINLFQLFVERALSLVRRGGRFGFVLPAGFASDHGCAALRRHLLGRTSVDSFLSLENRDGLFPIHRGLKFLLVSGATGGSTSTIACRFAVRSPETLDELADTGVDPAAVPVRRALIDRLTGDQAAIPELRTVADVELVSRLAWAFPMLGDPEGWHLSFGRELNATDDRRHFVAQLPRRGQHPVRSRRTCHPIIEGKQIRPFAVDLASARFGIPSRIAATLLNPEQTYAHPRLAYRDVASASNRLTLIAAIVPAGVVTTHTLFCLKQRLAPAVLEFLCAVFNSYVVNYLVRTRVSIHVTTAIVESLPVPVVSPESPQFRRVTAAARDVLARPGDTPALTRLQARVACLYALSEAEFAHVLQTFPLVPAAERDAALEAFRADS